MAFKFGLLNAPSHSPVITLRKRGVAVRLVLLLGSQTSAIYDVESESCRESRIYPHLGFLLSPKSLLCLWQVTMEALLVWIRENLLKERPEMFMKENSV